MILIIISVIVYYIRENTVNEQMLEMEKIIDLKENQTDRLGYINSTSIPYILEKDINGAYYALSDGIHLYVVYMTEDDFNKIDDQMIKNGYRLEGVTMNNPDSLEEYGIKFLEFLMESHSHEDHEHEEIIYTEKDFKDYFGNIYLDTMISKYHNFTILNIMFWGCLIMGISLLLIKFYLLMDNYLNKE